MIEEQHMNTILRHLYIIIVLFTQTSTVTIWFQITHNFTIMIQQLRIISSYKTSKT